MHQTYKLKIDCRIAGKEIRTAISKAIVLIVHCQVGGGIMLIEAKIDRLGILPSSGRGPRTIDRLVIEKANLLC